MARCSQIEPELQAYLDGELSKAKELIVEEHLSSCAHCKSEFEHLRKSNAYLHEALSPYKLNESLDEYIMRKLPEVDTHYFRAHEITLRVKHQDENPYSFSKIFPYLALTAMTILGVLIFISWPHKEISDTQRIGIALNVKGESSIIENNVHNSIRENRLTPLKNNIYTETQDNSFLYIYLKGNSTVKLSENTRVYILDERTINVEKGKVWFDIGKDRKIFRVHTPQGAVTVFGTQFQVEVNSEQVITTVCRGEVKVETADQFVVLKENQQVVVKGNNIDSQIKNCNSEVITAWVNEVKPSEYHLKEISTYFAETKPISIITPASQVFVVPIHQKEISTLEFYWDKQKLINNSNFTIYASDDELKPLFKYKLTNDLLTSLDGVVSIPVPSNLNLKNVNLLHIEIISDDLDDTSTMPFTKVFARN